jgi:hypothetical protein
MSRLRTVANAVIAKLGADVDLLALMPNGVYRPNRAPEGATALVEVSFAAGARDVPMFGGRALEDLRYTVVAVQRVTRGTPSRVGDAAARIDALLEDGTIDVGTDAGVMVLQRIAGIDEDTLTDATDPAIVWEYCGGLYQVMVTATGIPAPPPWIQTGWVQL